MRADCEAAVLGFGSSDGAREGLAVGAETFGGVEAGLQISTRTLVRAERGVEGGKGVKE
jgi:hypothetical protein